jgi:L,D-peptidoglycan transpeptidase YkuD (ErfK/YbiS/YcfS/YnhG family)
MHFRRVKKPLRMAQLQVLRVSRAPGQRARGLLRAGHRVMPVALGRSGIKANKREGDGASPRGRFRLLRLWWRADRGLRPRSLLHIRRIRPEDGWCEDPSDRRYNRPIQVPSKNPGDRLWREDGLYDLVIELDHNTRPRVAGRGSAVFIHVAREGFLPTAGCVALSVSDLRKLIGRLGRGTRIEIG